MRILCNEWSIGTTTIGKATMAAGRACKGVNKPAQRQVRLKRNVSNPKVGYIRKKRAGHGGRVGFFIYRPCSFRGQVRGVFIWILSTSILPRDWGGGDILGTDPASGVVQPYSGMAWTRLSVGRRPSFCGGWDPSASLSLVADVLTLRRMGVPDWLRGLPKGQMKPREHFFP